MSQRVFLFSANPGTVHKVFEIPKALSDLSPFDVRQHPAYSDIFQTIWKELESLDNTLFKQYQQLLKRKTLRSIISAYYSPYFLWGWELLSRLEWIDRLIFSSPTHVWHTFIEKVSDGSLTLHVSVTLMETVIGFIAGTLLGTLIAVVLWWSPLLSKILDPYLVILNAMPKVALGPILIVALGPVIFPS